VWGLKFALRTNPNSRCFDYISGVNHKSQGSSIETFDVHVGDEVMELNIELIVIKLKVIMRERQRSRDY